MKMALIVRLVLLEILVLSMVQAAESELLPPNVAFERSSQRQVWHGGRWSMVELVGRHYQTQIYVYRLSCDGFTDWSVYTEAQQAGHVLSYFEARLNFLADGIECGLLNAVELGASADEINFSSGIGLQKGSAYGNVLFGSIRGADFRRYAREISILRCKAK